VSTPSAVWGTGTETETETETGEGSLPPVSARASRGSGGRHPFRV